MTRLLVAFTVLIFLTTGCGVLSGDLPCCGPSTATPAPTQPSRELLKPPSQETPPRPSLPTKPSESLLPLPHPTETRSAQPTPTTPQKISATDTPAPAQSAGAPNTYWVTNPTSSARLYTHIVLPKGVLGKLPALVLVPGGIGWGGNFLDPPNKAQQLADAGFVVVIFDPDGRGKSAGKDDFDGFIHQDGLAAVVRFAAMLNEVDAQKIGIVTYSYGITMGSGVLARYPDLPVKFLIDWEGPADRNYTTSGCNFVGGKIHWEPCTDNAYWSEREAVNFIGKIRVPYQRVQSEKDHVQPTNAHAVDMINAAIKGGVPWVRLNDYPPNQTYDPKAPPAMFPERQDRLLEQKIAGYAQELLEK